MERPGKWRGRWSLSNISFKYRLPILIGTLLATVIVACTWASYRAVKACLLHHQAVPLALRQVDPLIRELTEYRDLVCRMTEGEIP